MSDNKTNCSKDPKETVKLEVYKGLIHYGCQMSADHLNYDRILMPISLVLASEDSNESNPSSIRLPSHLPRQPPIIRIETRRHKCYSWDKPQYLIPNSSILLDYRQFNRPWQPILLQQPRNISDCPRYRQCNAYRILEGK